MRRPCSWGVSTSVGSFGKDNMMAKSAVLAFVAAVCAFGSADAFSVNSAALQLKGSSFTAASAARPVQVPSSLLQARRRCLHAADVFSQVHEGRTQHL